MAGLEPIRTYVELYKNDGDGMAIRTNADKYDTFVHHFAQELATLVERERYKGDWHFQFSMWLPQMVEVCCQLKGYKADVYAQTVLTAGNVDPPAEDLINTPWYSPLTREADRAAMQEEALAAVAEAKGEEE